MNQKILYIICLFSLCCMSSDDPIPPVKIGQSVVYVESPSARGNQIGWIGKIILLNCETGKKQYITKYSASVGRIRISPDGSRLAYISEAPEHGDDLPYPVQALHLFEFKTGKHEVLWQSVLSKYWKLFWMLDIFEWSSDSTILLSTTRNVYEMPLNGSSIRSVLRLDSLTYISDLAFSPHNRFLALETHGRENQYSILLFDSKDSSFRTIISDKYVNLTGWIPGTDSLGFASVIYGQATYFLKSNKITKVEFPKEDFSRYRYLTKDKTIWIQWIDSLRTGDDIRLCDLSKRTFYWITNDHYFKFNLCVMSR